MHVAIAGWLTGLGPSGAQRRLLALLGAVVDQLEPGERITMLCGPTTPAPIELPDLPLHRVPLPPAPTWRRALAERRTLPGELARIGATLLDQTFLPVAPRLPCPTVLTVHDVRDLGPFRRRPRWLSRRVLAASLRRAAHVVVPSHYTENALRQAFGTRMPPCSVVPGGVDGDRFAPTPGDDRDDAANGDRPFFLHVGHLEPRKNLDLLLEAFAHSDCGAARLALVGRDAGQGQRLRRHASALGVADRVEFCGPVSDKTLARMYATAAAVVMPSLEEGFGLPALEALAAGRPTLVSDAGALPEVVAGRARIVPGRDPRAWARALHEALTTADPPEAGSARRAHAAQMSWSSAATALLEVWRSVAVTVS